jgi:hypothetical protein
MESSLAYSLTWQNLEYLRTTSQFNWLIFLMATLYSALLVAGMGFAYRLQGAPAGVGPPPLPSAPGAHLRGLGGWLVLVAIGLFGGFVTTGITILRTLHLFALWRWHELTTPGGSTYRPGHGPLVVLELLSQLTILLLCVYLVILFFQKRRAFPRWYIGAQVFTTAYVIADVVCANLIGLSSVPQERFILNACLAVLRCAVWIPYILTSLRVKVTFVR